MKKKPSNSILIIFTKKALLSFIIFCLIFSLLIPPKKTKAIYPALVAALAPLASMVGGVALDDFKDGLVDAAKQGAIESLGKNLNKKLNEFLNGKAPFITNWSSYIKKAKINVGLDWLNDIFGIDLCSTINPEIKIYFGSMLTQEKPSADCTLDKMVDSWNESMRYLESGNWLVLEEGLNPNANDIGKFYQIYDGLDDVLKTGERDALLETDTTKGFQSLSKCIDRDKKSGKCLKREIVFNSAQLKAVWEKIKVDLPNSFIINAKSFTYMIVKSMSSKLVDKIFNGSLFDFGTKDVKSSYDSAVENHEFYVFGNQKEDEPSE